MRAWKKRQRALASARQLTIDDGQKELLVWAHPRKMTIPRADGPPRSATLVSWRAEWAVKATKLGPTGEGWSFRRWEGLGGVGRMWRARSRSSELIPSSSLKSTGSVGGEGLGEGRK
jgi:hypothetical protein